MNRRLAAELVDLASLLSVGMIAILVVLVWAGQHEAFWQGVVVTLVIMAAGIFINIRYNIEEE